MARIRVQRVLLRDLREKELIAKVIYRKMYDKARGGFFRSQRHLKLYLQEQGLFQKPNRAGCDEGLSTSPVTGS